ncbi:mechanosensitive ion channel [Gluconacetobacter asukensis]|nr:mechanosensitive ion channel domain-containing protein [Gluconacetobacter asukensis]
MPILALLLGSLLLPATPGRAADAAPSSPPSSMTAQQAQQVLGVLNDPQKRAEFTRTLTAIANGLPQAAPAAPAAAATPPASSDKSDVALEPDSVGSDVLDELSTMRNGIVRQARSFAALFADLAFVGHWFRTELSDPASRHALFDAFGQAGLIIILALVAERGLSIALRRPLSSITAHAVEAERRLNQRAAQVQAEDSTAVPPGASQAERTVEDTRRQDDRKQVETLRIIRRIPFSLLHLLTKLLPVALFLGVGYAGATLFGDNDQAELVTLTLANAYAAARGMYLLVETVLVPKSPTIRLCRASDRTARIVTRWWNVLVAMPSIVVCLSTLGGLFHLAPRGTEALIRALVLAEHLMIAVFIWRIRHQVAASLQPPARFQKSSFWLFLGRLAQLWWLPAMVFDLALWLVWATHTRGGYAWIWRTTVLTIIVIVVSRVLSLLLFGAQNRLFHINDDVESRYPGLRARADYYYPYARRCLSALLIFATMVILLQAWGIPALSFFLHGELGTRIIAAILSILIAFTVAIVVWEAANAALQNQINRYETSEQVSRAIRLRTVLPIIRTVLLTVIVIIVAVTTLSQIGLNVAPLLTGAGIMGAAIAFGSQSLVKDFITGFFMLVENAMQVGDWVTAGGVSGTVEHLSIRTLRLRTTSGDVHIIPFSSVTSIANTSRDYNVVIVSFMLDLSENPDRVASILADVVAGMRADDLFAPLILSDFTFLGVDNADGNGAKFIGSFRTTPGSKWKVSREYYRRLGLRMVAEGVKFPIPSSLSLMANFGPTPLMIGQAEPAPPANTNTAPAPLQPDPSHD